MFLLRLSVVLAKCHICVTYSSMLFRNFTDSIFGLILTIVQFCVRFVILAFFNFYVVCRKLAYLSIIIYQFISDTVVHSQKQGRGVGVGWSPGFGPESRLIKRVSLFKETPTPGRICFIWTGV